MVKAGKPIGRQAAGHIAKETAKSVAKKAAGLMAGTGNQRQATPQRQADGHMLVRFEIAGIGVGQPAGGGQAAAPRVRRGQPGGKVDVEITVIAVEKHHAGQRRAGHGRHPANSPADDGRHPRARHTCLDRHPCLAKGLGGAVHVEEPLSMDMFLIAGDRPVSGFQQNRGKLVAIQMRPVLAQHRQGRRYQRRGHAGAGHRGIAATKKGRGDVGSGGEDETVADPRRITAASALPCGADIAGPVANDGLAGDIPVADHKHLPVQQQRATVIGGGGKLVEGGAVIRAAVAGRLDQNLARAERRRPPGGKRPDAVEAVFAIAIPGIVKIIASIPQPPETRFQEGVAQIGGADIDGDRILVTSPCRRLARLVEAVAAAHRNLADKKLRVEGTAMDADAVTLRRDNSGHMRAVAIGIGPAGAGEIAVAGKRRGQIGMVLVNAGIGNGDDAATPGPSAGIGGAETGGGKRCLPAAGVIFGRLVTGRV